MRRFEEYNPTFHGNGADMKVLYLHAGKTGRVRLSHRLYKAIGGAGARFVASVGHKQVGITPSEGKGTRLYNGSDGSYAVLGHAMRAAGIEVVPGAYYAVTRHRTNPRFRVVSGPIMDRSGLKEYAEVAE